MSCSPELNADPSYKCASTRNRKVKIEWGTCVRPAISTTKKDPCVTAADDVVVLFVAAGPTLSSSSSSSP